MLLLISDANIFIDIEDDNLTSVVFRLPYEIAVPDILFEFGAQRTTQLSFGGWLKVRSLTAESVKRIESLSFKYSRPSLMDHSALALAMQ